MTIPTPHIHGDDASASTADAKVDRKNLAFVAMERTRMPMVVTDPRLPDNPIVLANRAFLNQTGYPAEEVIGRNCRFLQGPGTDRGVVATIRAAVEQGGEVRVELLNYRKDGTPFWNALYISPIHDDDGNVVYFFASQQDTSRQHEASDLEAAERQLLREIDHRAKNALALVQGIVRLTRRTDIDTFASAVQGRVDALARAHAILADGHWRDVPLDRIVRSEVEPFGMNRVHLSGSGISLAVAHVQPVALLLHELADNAHRHGALSADGGHLAITWRYDTATRALNLRWSETGGPPPPDPRISGYGQRMIEAIATRQLRGAISYDWAETGLIATIDIPDRSAC